MRLRYSGALACLLALAGIPAGAAVGASTAAVTHDAPVVRKEHCRVLPASAQRAPASTRRAQYAAKHPGAGMKLTVVVPRTTCNAGR